MKRRVGFVVFVTLFIGIWLLNANSIGENNVPTEHINETIQGRMSRRLRLARATCRRYGIDSSASALPFRHPSEPLYDHFHFHRFRFAYCPTPKVASTSMSNWLLHLKGIRENYPDADAHERVYKMYPAYGKEKATQLLDRSAKLVVVRHPFLRLISAYRDKMDGIHTSESEGDLFYSLFGRHIVAKYRKNNNTNTNKFPTFAEFVQYVIDTNDLVTEAAEFWIPQFQFCTPCLIDYDFVVKLETFAEDMTMVVDRLNVPYPPGWNHMTAADTSQAAAASYFGTISRDQVLQLYNKYLLDFQLFNYSIEPFLAFSQS